MPATSAPAGIAVPLAGPLIGFAPSPSMLSVGDAPEVTFGTKLSTCLSRCAKVPNPESVVSAYAVDAPPAWVIAQVVPPAAGRESTGMCGKLTR